MKNRLWEIVGWFYSHILNRMRCGDNRRMWTWNTINPAKVYEGYSFECVPTLPMLLAHTFWHGEILNKQLFSIKSFLCTQDLSVVKLIIWMDGDLWYEKAKANKELKVILDAFNGKVEIRKWNFLEQIRDTPFNKIKWYFKWHRPLPAVADDFRIVALSKYGGLYFDLDVMFVKDFKPLFMRDEFVYAWENQPFANSAILFLRKGSYLSCRLVEIMIKKKSSQPWALFRYNIKSLTNMMVYPCAMFDPLWQGYRDGMPIKDFSDFFRKFDDNFKYDTSITSFTDFFPGIYAYHWHNYWGMETHENSYFGIFNAEFDEIIKCLYQ